MKFPNILVLTVNEHLKKFHVGQIKHVASSCHFGASLTSVCQPPGLSENNREVSLPRSSLCVLTRLFLALVALKIIMKGFPWQSNG